MMYIGGHNKPPSPAKWGGKKYTHLLSIQNLASIKFAISDVIIKKNKSQLLGKQALPFFSLIPCCLDE